MTVSGPQDDDPSHVAQARRHAAETGRAPARFLLGRLSPTVAQSLQYIHIINFIMIPSRPLRQSMTRNARHRSGAGKTRFLTVIH